MAKCKNCKYLLRKVDKDFAHAGLWCPQIIDSPHEDTERNCEHYKTMTNVDRIRSMTDEELAAFIINFDNRFGEEYEGEQSFLSWLRRESEEQ